MWHSDPNFNVVLIVTLALGFMAGVPIMIAWLIANNAKKKREAELVRLAIEKGQPLPEFPVQKPSRFGALKASFVWIAVGLGFISVTIFDGVPPWENISIGFIPILVGLALMLGWFIEKRDQRAGSI
jgi:hypothetical protein